MARLIYSTIASLDGYIEDGAGRFDWARPDAEVMAFVNDEERSVGTYLYGRRMYETMVFWETAPVGEGEPAFVQDWTRMWRAAEKVVYSRSLQSVSSAKTRIERSFDPPTVRRLKETSGADLSLGGADLAGQAFRAGLIDEIRWYVVPALVGAGKSWLPKDARIDLELLDVHRFTSGFVRLRYRPVPVRSASSAEAVS
jgi:dihydrofolate reductase